MGFHDEQPFPLPAGFRPVSRTDPDFDAVKTRSSHGWSAYLLAVLKGEGFSTFITKNAPSGTAFKRKEVRSVAQRGKKGAPWHNGSVCVCPW